jgi:hypothetical protein
MHSVLVLFRVLHIITLALMFLSLAQIGIGNIVHLLVVNSIVEIEGNLHCTFRISASIIRILMSASLV